MLVALLVLSLSPSQAQASLLREGRALLRQERFDEAARTFLELTESEPSARAFYYLGVALSRLGDVEEAVSALERARDLSPPGGASPAVLYELGTSYLHAERYSEAARIFESATEAAPDEARFRLQLGWAYYRLVEGEKAESQFRAALAREPENVTAHFYRGLALAALGRLSEAERSFRDAIEREPSHADARLGLARVVSQAGRDDEARAELNAVLETAPRSAAAAHNELALLALRSGDTAEATRRFEATVAAEPDHRQATYNLWLLYRRAGRGDEAASMRERFEALDETPPARSLSRTAAKPRDP